MKKRFSLLLFVLLLSIFLLCPSVTLVSATDREEEDNLLENVEELLDELDLEDLQAYLRGNADFSAWDVKEKIVELISGGITDYDSVFDALFSSTKETFLQFLPVFVLVFTISVLCGVLNALKASFAQDGTSRIVFFVCYAASLIIVFADLTDVFSVCSDCMKELKKQMEIVFPLLLTLMAASGGSVSASVYTPAVAFLSNGVATILLDIVLPIAMAMILVNTVSHLNPDIKLDGYLSLLKSVNKWIIGISVAVFGLFLSVQGISSAAYDGISLRAAKYAISNSVPIVGSFLSGGFDLVLAGNTLIKNSIGVLGIFMIASVLAKPIVVLASFSLVLKLTAAVCEPIGESRMPQFLGKLSECISYWTAALLSLGFLYFLTVLLLICSAEVII